MPKFVSSSGSGVTPITPIRGLSPVKLEQTWVQLEPMPQSKQIESKILEINESIATLQHCKDLKPYQTARSKRISEDLRHKIVQTNITKNMYKHMLGTQRKLNFLDKLGGATGEFSPPKLKAKLQPKPKKEYQEA